MTVDGECYPLQMWERTIRERDGFYWRTPTAADGKNMGCSNQVYLTDQVRLQQVTNTEKLKTLQKMTMWPSLKSREKGKLYEGLSGAVKMWPTPKANDSEKRGEFDLENPRNGLPAAVKKWPTPAARDWKGTNGYESTKKKLAQGKRAQTGQLPNAVMMEQGAGGQLNPTWVEWLMGYPLGHTALEAWATLWFQPKRAKPSKG
jgi:hypothetical protein